MECRWRISYRTRTKDWAFTLCNVKENDSTHQCSRPDAVHLRPASPMEAPSIVCNHSDTETGWSSSVQLLIGQRWRQNSKNLARTGVKQPNQHKPKKCIVRAHGKRHGVRQNRINESRYCDCNERSERSDPWQKPYYTREHEESGQGKRVMIATSTHEWPKSRQRSERPEGVGS